MGTPSSLKLIAWSEDQRMQMHDAYRKFVAMCTEQDYEALMRLREQVAPGQVCSIVTLISSCYQKPELLDGIPSSLVQLLKERNLPPPSAGASSFEE